MIVLEVTGPFGAGQFDIGHSGLHLATNNRTMGNRRLGSLLLGCLWPFLFMRDGRLRDK